MHDLLLIFHLLLFVYWLGGDLGVFYSSGRVVDPSLSNSARATAARIMVNLDFVPRICMSLTLTAGGLLSMYSGIEHPTWQIAGFIALGPFWLGMVVFLHYAHGSALSRAVTRVDFWFRWALVAYLLVSVSYSFGFTDKLAQAPWIGAKLIAFAAMVFCGLMIRIHIPGYVQGISALHAHLNEPSLSPEENRSMQLSLGRCRPYVIAIWVLLLAQCYLGVVKPGG